MFGPRTDVRVESASSATKYQRRQAVSRLKNLPRLSQKTRELIAWKALPTRCCYGTSSSPPRKHPQRPTGQSPTALVRAAPIESTMADVSSTATNENPMPSPDSDDGTPQNIQTYIMRLLSLFPPPVHGYSEQDEFIGAVYFLLKQPDFLSDHDWLHDSSSPRVPDFDFRNPADFQKLQIGIYSIYGSVEVDSPSPGEHYQAVIQIDRCKMVRTDSRLSHEDALTALYEDTMNLAEQWGFGDPDYDDLAEFR
ncbi:hypothetical protein BDU57DRAFT_526358 [Ampelomyces quisqualis]|uniref:Uncharacterized protein n=1 Tax=Ampelomyces quisqualis TaxID=50730 RepID=A0A6A5R0G1_AMPQU|nr:hypothetical protein BDU57DRAFT_526358 [Ampelomyces quisqualis]